MVRELAKYFNITLKEDNIPHVLDAMKGHSQEGVFAIHEHTRYLKLLNYLIKKKFMHSLLFKILKKN